MAIKKTGSKQNCMTGGDCPDGYYCGPGGTCLPQKKSPGTFSGPSVKVAGAILGGAGAAIGTYLSAGKRDAKKKEKAEQKKIDDTAKKITSNVMKKGGWIDSAIKKPGALREQLGIKKGKTIPKATLAAAAKKGGKLGQRARLAITLGKMKKK